MNRILATGVTGFIGTASVVELLRLDPKVEIVGLARSGGGQTAQERVAEAVHEECQIDGCPEFAPTALERIVVVDGDVADPDVVRRDIPKVDTIFHCAARVNVSRDDLGAQTLAANTTGTRHMLDLAKRLRVETFHYVSTAYVSGKRDGTVYEEELVPTEFNNAYERSKFQAERLVRAAGIPFTIYRPSIVVGRLDDGVARKPTGFYHIVKFLSVLKKRACARDDIPESDWHPFSLRVPVRERGHVHLVPITFVQEATARLVRLPVRNRTYHLTGGMSLPSDMLIREIACWIGIGGMRPVPLPDDFNEFIPEEEELLFWEHMRDVICYFGSWATFDASNLKRDLDTSSLDGQLDRPAVARMIEWYLRTTTPELLEGRKTAGVKEPKAAGAARG
jgi:thioester reductase-like protein